MARRIKRERRKGGRRDEGRGEDDDDSYNWGILGASLN